MKIKKLLKRGLKIIGFILLIPVTYLLVSLLLTAITVNNKEVEQAAGQVYLNSNGIHLEVVLPLALIEKELLYGLNHYPNDSYLSFGWGDEDFYLNTPEWSDLTIGTALNAAFLDSPTLIHITRYSSKQRDWIAVPATSQQLDDLQTYFNDAFMLDELGEKQRLAGKGYSSRDDFYRAKGNYSCFKTCNSWVNTGFKRSGLKAAFWTPFDFGLMNKYR